MSEQGIDVEWRPDSGGLRHEFNFDPLHYGVGGDRQAAFKALMRSKLRQYGFLLTGEVAITWRLLVDEQERWESDTGADVDNFAKLLNDGLLGPDGILIDDVQVQSMHVYWDGARGNPSFELTIQCSPDEWITRPASLYELADGLWYPLGRSVRDNPEGARHLLYALDNRVLFGKRLRHQLRRHGFSPALAYEVGKQFAILARGFHSTRAASSQLPRIRRTEWTKNFVRPVDAPAPSDRDIEALAAAIAATHGKK